MKELNGKLILLFAFCFLGLGVGFYILFPSESMEKVRVPSIIKKYASIDIKESKALSSEWPKAEEQAKGEMFDLFTPPEIYINKSEIFCFVLHMRLTQ